MIDNPQNFQTEIVDEINEILDVNPSESSTLSEMSYKERCFLNGIIRQTKPKKILEVGVSAGGSSALILNATKDNKDTKLYSVDYNEKWYRDNTKRTGFVIDEQYFRILRIGGNSTQAELRQSLWKQSVAILIYV